MSLSPLKSCLITRPREVEDNPLARIPTLDRPAASRLTVRTTTEHLALAALALAFWGWSAARWVGVAVFACATVVKAAFDGCRLERRCRPVPRPFRSSRASAPRVCLRSGPRLDGRVKWFAGGSPAP
jgi:hypothetical protein